jgi:hypothetical protein
VNDFEGLGMVKNFGFNATRSKNQKKMMGQLKTSQKTRILDLWLESADRPTGPRIFLFIFGQEPLVTWKFDYSSQNNTNFFLKLTLKVDISHLVTFWT